MPTTSQITVIRKQKVAPDTIEISFTRPSDFTFTAGQYVQLNIPELLHPDPKGSSRTFSIASSPEEVNMLRIAFRNTESGYKKTLIDMPNGTRLDLEGPLGFFTLPQNTGNLRNVFVAGGIGITPFMSMIRSADANKFKKPLTLVYANRDLDSTAYSDELSKLEKKYDLFTLTNILGRISSQHINNFIQDTESILWWVVGPPNMVAEVNNLLISCGVDSSSIRHEEFTGY